MPKGQFTRAQNDYIESFFPQFVVELDKGLSGVPLTQWKQGKASDILDSTTFQGLDLDKLPRKTWFEMIVRKFTNYRNQTYLKGNTNAVAAVPNKKTNPLMKFSSILSGRQLFSRENKNSWSAAVEQRIRDTNTTNRGAVHQNILSEKWNALTDVDKAHWNDRAEAEAGNIQRNQQEFPETITLALQDLCRGGLVGDAEMVLFYGFRDSEGRDLISGSIHAHSERNNKQFGADQAALQNEYEQAWWDFTDRVIPHSIGESPLIPRNSAGHPVFPAINLESTLTADIRTLLVDFFEQCWVVQSSDEKVIGMPWDEIASDADKFYDTLAFPINLDHPQNLSTDRVHALAAELLRTSGPDSIHPFRFRDFPNNAPSIIAVPPKPDSKVETPNPLPRPESHAPPPEPPVISPKPAPRILEEGKLEDKTSPKRKFDDGSVLC
ncbi:hypothetical protein R3P38DRAFT_2508308 [Favolaschia claudopus]|uniref:Uncharacterized protein n=1 Tax=Favolaschia claudopus TaxID=2862362 RepID=A0AAW0D5U1_9AGAR